MKENKTDWGRTDKIRDDFEATREQRFNESKQSKKKEPKPGTADIAAEPEKFEG